MTRGEQGSALPFTFISLATLSFVALLIGSLGGVMVTRRQVASAADLAALSGATALQVGREACRAAQVAATHNGARLVACRVDDAVVTVQVARLTPVAFGHRFRVLASARAGPAS